MSAIARYQPPTNPRSGKLGVKPIFFPDATCAVVKTLDMEDIRRTRTPGVLVNTYHLLNNPGLETIQRLGGVKPFMNWSGLTVSDSGGFQIMSLGKKTKNSGRFSINDEGVIFKPSDRPTVKLTPQLSLSAQFVFETDLAVALDDFTPPTATLTEARKTVKRTLLWAEKTLAEYDKLSHQASVPPLLTGVVQGGSFAGLRKECARELIKMGYPVLGFGGWPITETGQFDYHSAEIIASEAKSDTLLYGLGIGKPQEIKALFKMGYTVFDCVLPTRDARHKRLYIYNSDTLANINISSDTFYSYYIPDRSEFREVSQPVSKACDCHLCTNYSRAYLHHLFKIKDVSAMRLATIHNLRFYSLLMEKLALQKRS